MMSQTTFENIFHFQKVNWYCQKKFLKKFNFFFEIIFNVKSFLEIKISNKIQ